MVHQFGEAEYFFSEPGKNVITIENKDGLIGKCEYIRFGIAKYIFVKMGYDQSVECVYFNFVNRLF